LVVDLGQVGEQNGGRVHCARPYTRAALSATSRTGAMCDTRRADMNNLTVTLRNRAGFAERSAK
jgi:hypothetical protein